MKKNNKAIQKKSSLFKTDGVDVVFIMMCAAIIVLILLPVMAIIESYHKEFFSWYMVAIVGIIILILLIILINLICEIKIALYRRKRLPLNQYEMKNLNITNLAEYWEFAKGYIHSIAINNEMINRIVFTGYLYLYDKDTDKEKENNLHNTFKFSKAPVCAESYKYIYDYSNMVTVCNEKCFNDLKEKMLGCDIKEDTESETNGEKQDVRS